MKINPYVFSAKFPERCRPEACRSRCCRYGAWIDAGEREAILAVKELFLPYVRPAAADPSRWFGKTMRDEDCPSGTAVETMEIDDFCVFFHPGHGCALQKAATATGLHEWTFKPRFCVMFPLVLLKGELTVDEEMKSLWCMKERNRTHPIVRSVAKEVRYLFGEDLARRLSDPVRGPCGPGTRDN